MTYCALGIRAMKQTNKRTLSSQQLSSQCQSYKSEAAAVSADAFIHSFIRSVLQRVSLAVGVSE